MRIKIIDGYRAIAILGVLWVHIWTFYGNPSFTFLGIDIARLISFFGTGVDLFFVISGFCMYLMYASRQVDYSVNYFAEYLKKRWFRIAPAFYVAILVYGLFSVGFNMRVFDWMYALKNALFIRTFFTQSTQYAPHFWSLCTEMHFYIVLPLILFSIKKFSFFKAIYITIIICLIFRVIVWRENNDTFNLVNYSILNRLIEFLMGIIAAYLYKNKIKIWINKNLYGLLLGTLIAFIGRVLMYSGFQNRSDTIGILARVFSLPLLTLGFGAVIMNSLNFKSIFSSFLESSLMTSIGKYSYSMYLWHWIVAARMVSFFQIKWNFDPFIKINLTFIMCLIILFPLSKLSYYLFESFYFKEKLKVVKLHSSITAMTNKID